MGRAVKMLYFLVKSKVFLFICCVFAVFLVVYGADVGDSYFGSKQEACASGDDCQNQLEHENMNADENAQVKPQLASHEEVDSNNTQNEINIIFTFVNAVSNRNLQKQFTQTVSSLFHHVSVPLVIHIIGEEESQNLARSIITNNAGEAKFRMVNLDIDKLATELDDIVKPMQHHFSAKKGAYYSHALFFMSIAIHRVMPESLHRIIMLDADLKFTDDILKLYEHFDKFTEENIMGIGRELQPVYQHTFWEYRQKNPGTRVGEPPPNGLTGFNSGVLLLDLDHMRKSELYNSVLSSDVLDKLTKEFYFKGHLGDQDLFTLLSMKYEQLFYVLPCVWNRQLCTWWKDHGYEKIFDKYFKCEGDIKIWHGNCNTPIP